MHFNMALLWQSYFSRGTMALTGNWLVVILCSIVTTALYKLLRLVFTTVQSIYWQLNGTARKLREARLPAAQLRAISTSPRRCSNAPALSWPADKNWWLRVRPQPLRTPAVHHRQRQHHSNDHQWSRCRLLWTCGERYSRIARFQQLSATVATVLVNNATRTQYKCTVWG